MKTALRLVFVVGLVGALAACSQLAPKSPALQTTAVSGVRILRSSGTTSFRASGQSTLTGVQGNELPPFDLEGSVGQSQPGNIPANIANRLLNRIPEKSNAPIHGSGATIPDFTPPSGTVLGTAPLGSVANSFEGLNHFDQRTADNANQFSVEPPDQGLCVGNGHVLEAVNDVLRVYQPGAANPADRQGAVYSLNQFFNYPSQIDRHDVSGQPKYGPFVTDPSCVYSGGHFYLVVLTLDVARGSGQLMGSDHLDIAVSKTNDPNGDWYYYHLDVTMDGASCPCLGDYPHIAADDNGLYITTDSFPFYATPRNGGYNGAWVYAIDAQGLASGGPANLVAMPMVDSEGLVGYSVAPANPPGDMSTASTPHGATAKDTTEYFLSSTTVNTYSATDVDVWALDGTNTLASAHPRLTLSSTRVSVTGDAAKGNGISLYGDPFHYAVPQMVGDVPQADALNANLFGFGAPPKTQVEGPVATNDSGMKQTVFVNGHLYGALTTAVANSLGLKGGPGAGIAWFDITPSMKDGSVQADLVKAGVVDWSDANLIFPAITVNSNGQGVIAATGVGPDMYPSAVAIPFDAGYGGGGPAAGTPQVVGGGMGPQDGFTEYFIGGNDPRWGDYGASTVDASGHLWMASEAINQVCSSFNAAGDKTSYVATSGTCGGTRTALGNWSTQITEITPPTP